MSDALTLPPAWPAAGLDAVHAALTAPGAPFEMGSARVDGQALRVYRHAPRNLRVLLAASAGLGSRPCLVFEDERIDYGEFHRRVAALATALREQFGVEPGERVAIAMRNYPEWVIAFWAITASGAVAVLLNGWWSGEELGFGVRDSGARVVLADAERAARLHAALPETRRPPLLVTRGEPPGPGDARFEPCLQAAHARLPAADPASDDPAAIIYTSGTTGRPKGAISSHRNIVSNLFSRRYNQARAALRRGAALPAWTFAARPNALLCPVPLFHVTGCHSLMVPTLASGDTLVLMHRWDVARALRLVERERVATLSGVPFMIWQLLDHLDTAAAARLDLSSLQTLTWGGSPAGAALVAAVRSRLPGRLTGNGYGMTETASLISQASAEDHIARPDSVGRPVPVGDVRIVAADGRPLGVGQTGEIQVRGPQVMRGYWGQPEASAAVLVDGWLRTGDLGHVDAEGFLYVVDRIKDIVIRAGENVASALVEARLMQHPRVLDAAVLGLPHASLGEEVAAVVQVSPGADVDAAALAGFLSDQLASFEIPSRWHLQRTALPRNAAGKVMKSSLRDALTGRHPDTSAKEASAP